MGSIQLHEVTKAFPKSAAAAVDRVTLEIADGEFLVLVGPSGCGKSTLLRMIAGIEDISSGQILIDGTDATHAPPKERDIAMVFQSYALYPQMTVAENLSFALKLRKMPKAERTQRVDDVMRMLRLTELASRTPGQLSGGQRQRVAMGRAMVREPAAFLMDEPLSNLDAKLRIAMRSELARLHERLGVTTIYVTHDQIEAMTLGQRVAVLKDGALQQVGTPQELFHQPRNLFVAAFIGSPTINLVEAEVSDGSLQIGGHAIPVPAHAALTAGSKVVVGVRPSAFELAEFADASAPRLSARLEVVENLGDEIHAIFPLDAPRVDVDAAVGVEQAGDEQLLVDERALFTAALVPRRSLSPGDEVELAIDTSRLQFFDPESGLALAGPTTDENASERKIHAG
ncbi:ABC transporter ATP-binding protein [Conexibacter woesei]|uniref:ABC transporter related protein n=1 Tax=Conexibacter woesei (strain DSM 14684 / CCUG 47730 / CIP 108061 / JCM 11494 / NBRC 100937 / ID131577) TaxID=469383 RepID=D3F7U2_CONWI|nr:ABC transporter ATP-binding protein [Conexibacter woesei]ADB52836.1 ABC transporter related protein [Conexibacter woesei DSM 14684]